MRRLRLLRGTAKAFFGPTGVDETYRGKGIGKALLLVCLHDMYAQGYAYGIIGDAGSDGVLCEGGRRDRDPRLVARRLSRDAARE